MCKEKIEQRQTELQKEAQKLVEARAEHSKKVNEINVRLEQIKGAFSELETQKADLDKTDSPKKESPKKETEKKIPLR